MKHLTKFIRATLLGGLLVLFPLFGSVYFIVFIGGLVTSTIRPILGLIFADHFANLPYADVISFGILVLLSFLTGIFVRTSPGKAMTNRLALSLDNIRLFRMLRRLGVIFFDAASPRGAPVLASFGDSKEFGFLIEEVNDDEFMVFFPEVPRPFYGNIKIMPAKNVLKLDWESSDLVRVIGNYGVGSKILLADSPSKPTIPVKTAQVELS